MKNQFNAKKLKSRRQELRCDMPEPERRLWMNIRDRQVLGVKFRRQCSIGRYIVDFYSFEKKVVIEVDGDSHFESRKTIEYDRKRTEYLESLGIHVIRFGNDDIMNKMDDCMECLESVLR